MLKDYKFFLDIDNLEFYQRQTDGTFLIFTGFLLVFAWLIEETPVCGFVLMSDKQKIIYSMMQSLKREFSRIKMNPERI